MIFFHGPKQPGEIIPVGVDLKDRLATGETLTSPAATAKRLDTGADATAAVLSNPPAISGTQVLATMIDGTSLVDYQITITVQTSAGKKFEAEIIVPVREL